MDYKKALLNMNWKCSWRKISVLNRRICSKLNRSQKFYVAGFLLIPVAAVLAILPVPLIVSYTVLGIGAFLIFSGVVSDAAYVFNFLWKNTLVRGVLLLFYALLSVLVYGFSSQVVNQMIHFDVGEMTNTLAFTAFMLIPLVLFTASLIVFTLGLFLAELYVFAIDMMKFVSKNRCFNVPLDMVENYHVKTFIARLVVYIFGVFLFFVMGSVLKDPYNKFLEKSVSWYAYNFEAVKHSRCQFPEGKDGKVVLLGSDEMLFVERKGVGYVFTPMKCVSVLGEGK